MECPECKTENGYYKVTTDEWVCRKCGTQTKANHKRGEDGSQTN